MADAVKRVQFDGKIHEFPADFTDAEISAALGAIPEANAPQVPNAPTWKTVVATGSAAAVPTALRVAEGVATNPGVPAAAAQIGRIVGAVGPAVGEFAAGNVPAGLAMAGQAGRSAWAGGKAGWFTGKLLQNAAAPVASALETIRPFTSALGAAAGAGEATEPGRTDASIVGSSDNVVAQRAAVMKMQIQNLVDQGVPINEALRRVSDAWRPR
jgi:hypothetical protein